MGGEGRKKGKQCRDSWILSPVNCIGSHWDESHSKHSYHCKAQVTKSPACSTHCYNFGNQPSIHAQYHMFKTNHLPWKKGRKLMKKEWSGENGRGEVWGKEGGADISYKHQHTHPHLKYFCLFLCMHSTISPKGQSLLMHRLLSKERDTDAQTVKQRKR